MSDAECIHVSTYATQQSLQRRVPEHRTEKRHEETTTDTDVLRERRERNLVGQKDRNPNKMPTQ